MRLIPMRFNELSHSISLIGTVLRRLIDVNFKGLSIEALSKKQLHDFPRSFVRKGLIHRTEVWIIRDRIGKGM